MRQCIDFAFQDFKHCGKAFYLMMLMPGRRFLMGLVGRAFTSKVFMSNWPYDFVAFHAA